MQRSNGLRTDPQLADSPDSSRYSAQPNTTDIRPGQGAQKKFLGWISGLEGW